MTRALLALALLAATTARADVWKQASAGPDDARELYEEKLEQGDELVGQANAHQITRALAKHLVDQARKAYLAAGAAEPTEGEPYFRLGRMLYSFYLECRDYKDPGTPARSASSLCDPDAALDSLHPDLVQIAEQVLAAYDELERRAPLDPRLGAISGDGLLFRRAILHTQLATKDHLAAAAREYEKILRRADPSVIDETVLSNLAETYMMLDRLDDAIDTYRRAIARGADFTTGYGLAVALDRDERGDEALDVIRSQGRQSVIEFHSRYMTGSVFFVPEGEQFYYFALVDEAWGDDTQALEFWKAYIKSGAHAEFQPRARAHVAALQAKLKAHPPAQPYRWDDDPPLPVP